MTSGRSSGCISGRVALVTGGGKGIGAAIVRRLREAGVQVAATGRDRASLDAVARETGARAFVADVTDASAMADIVTLVERDLGPIDILVPNAGIAESHPLAGTTDELWDRTLAVNVTAPFRLTRALLPGMVQRGRGRVVFVASNAGLSGYAYTASYCASKHALVGLMRALAAEFARTKVTLNAVCPGFTETDMATRAAGSIAAKAGRSHEDARKALESLSPQRRLMTPDEVAHAVLLLCDDAAQGIHGQAIAIDGGQTMR